MEAGAKGPERAPQVKAELMQLSGKLSDVEAIVEEFRSVLNFPNPDPSKGIIENKPIAGAPHRVEARVQEIASFSQRLQFLHDELGKILAVVREI